MRRIACAAIVVVFASPASAGSGDAARAGLRRLDWPGKVAATASALVVSRPVVPARRPETAAAPIVPAAVPPAPVALAASPAALRPRIYSLHREYGETPDRPELPAPLYLDGLPVAPAETPAPSPTDAPRAADSAPDPSIEP
jgi:hypothetical protein